MKLNHSEPTIRANPQRRTLLRGALITVIGFPLLWGCKPKESANTGTTTLPDAVPPASDTPSATQSPPASTDTSAPSAKMSKAQAQYQSQPKGEQQCSTCMHFLAAYNTCALVEGQIEPQAWCILWAKQPT